MDETTNKKESKDIQIPEANSKDVASKSVGGRVYVPKESSRSYQGQGNSRGQRTTQGGGRGGPGGQRGRGGPRGQRTPSEYDQKILNIRRVARIVAGGRRFTFSVAMVIGNRKGSVGVGTGKAGDTVLAIDKATRSAKKSMIKLNLTKDNSIAHEVSQKYSSATVMIRPARGKGLVAGSAVRIVLELGGVTDTTAKVVSRSKNKLNIARATIKALKKLS